MKHFVAVVTLALLVVGPSALAQEHPEHPEKKDKVERAKSAETMTLDELADAITHYIEQDSKLKGG